MAIALAATAHFNDANATTTFSVPNPGGSGGLLVIAVRYSGMTTTSYTPASPAGWTLAGYVNDPTGFKGTVSSCLAVFYAEASDAGSGPWTFSKNASGTNVGVIGTVSRFSGAAATAPEPSGGFATQATTTGSTGTFPSVTAAEAGDLLFLAAGQNPASSDNSTWPGTAASPVVPAGTTYLDSFVAAFEVGAAYQLASAAGATGSKTVACKAAGSSAYFLAAALIIKTAGDGGGVTPPASTSGAFCYVF